MRRSVVPRHLLCRLRPRSALARARLCLALWRRFTRTVRWLKVWRFREFNRWPGRNRRPCFMEGIMPYAPFHKLCPEIASRETRTVTVLPHASLGLEPADYEFVEMYCDEPGCDCRRVMFSVLSSARQRVEA